MIGRNGERRSGISAQTARHDDDDDDIFPKGIKSESECNNSTRDRTRLLQDCSPVL